MLAVSPPAPDPAALCPEIHRQRLIIEGLFGVEHISETFVQDFLGELTQAMGMTAIAEPVIFSPDAVSELHHGIGGFQPWAESGCSLYTWREQRLFTLDIYSCKPFQETSFVAFATDRLQAQQINWRSA